MYANWTPSFANVNPYQCSVNAQGEYFCSSQHSIEHFAPNFDIYTIRFDAKQKGRQGPNTKEETGIGSRRTELWQLNVENGIHFIKIPKTGQYEIVCGGAQGGKARANEGYNGIICKGTYTFTDQDVLKIIVGQKGDDAGPRGGGGGGGGSFVLKGNELIIAAGGGGGAGNKPKSGSGGILASGNGNGGKSKNAMGGGGGGLYDGQTSSNGGGGGKSFLNGAFGGEGIQPGFGGNGGFGGGGGGSETNGWSGGGGGGYTGGDGALNGNDSGGGGGTCFGNGITYVDENKNEMGYVILKFIK